MSSESFADGGPVGEVHGIPCLGNSDEVESVIARLAVTQVVLLELPTIRNVHQHLVSVVERHGVRLLIYNNLEEKLNHPVIYLEDDGHHFIALRKEPLENPLNRMAKRTLDIAVSLPVILFILPPIAFVVWIIQRIYSPGPLFFRQMRAGIQNNQFLIWKFRTMHVNNERGAPGHEERRAHFPRRPDAAPPQHRRAAAVPQRPQAAP